MKKKDDIDYSLIIGDKEVHIRRIRMNQPNNSLDDLIETAEKVLKLGTVVVGIIALVKEMFDN